MASIEEVKAQILMAAGMLEGAVAGYLNAAQLDIEDVTRYVQAGFEGTGRPEFMEIIGQLQSMNIQLTDDILNVLGMASRLNDAAAMM